jgi:hypothetical protein
MFAKIALMANQSPTKERRFDHDYDKPLQMRQRQRHGRLPGMPRGNPTHMHEAKHHAAMLWGGG